MHTWHPGQQYEASQPLLRCWKTKSNLLFIDFPQLIPPPISTESLQNPTKPSKQTSKAICCQHGCLTRPHPKQVATQSGQITMPPPPPFLPITGHLHIPSTTWLASKPRNTGRRISNIFGSHFLLHSRDKPRPSAQRERPR